MSKLVFLGAEVPSNKVILGSMNAKRVGFSYWGAVKRGLPTTKKFLLSDRFNDDVEIYVFPGVPAAAQLMQEELEGFCADYEHFISENIERITIFTEVQHPNLPAEFMAKQRSAAWNDVDDEKFGVVYASGNLEDLATRYLNVFMPGETAEIMAPICRKLAAQHGTKFHVMGMAKPDALRNSPFETASTLSWLSPMMRGETIVWFGNQLHRYPKSMKEQARPRYKTAYEAANLDFDKILADDAAEVSKLAVWSFQQLEIWLNSVEHIATTSDEKLPPQMTQTTPSNVDISTSETNKLIARNPIEMTTLPVLGVEVTRVIETDETGRDVLKEVPVMRSNSTSLRQCNTCFVKDNCPAYKPDNACAFSLPVEVKTKEQLKGLINSLLEIQGQRVAFAKFTEDLNGGYPDPNVGQEMDRFFKMLKTIKELDESKEMMRVTVERSGGAGVLSNLFGERAQKLNELPNNGLNEEQTNEVIKKINPTDL
ncbi:hypothetical protein UFOVP115_86 [uncultured Caudovirales phage]|uniref:Uncharacterized protein n=1 Tax=uncultured Caudovirales phage TaxID=2100421 RepID=A0A6J5L5L3_9CAUD|nr:hypothetical protein UFOVP115_86 [uncultured Caudovirales phage]